MKNTKHTPGPWLLDTAKSLIYNPQNNSGIARLVSAGTTDDARLIAAAPELLAFVEECLKLQFMVPEATALIAKATGGAS